MTTETTAAAPITSRTPPTGYVPLEMPVEIYGGKEVTRSADGGVTPIKTIKSRHKLEDQTVRRIIAFAMEISAQVARFRLHAMDDVVEFQNIMAEEFNSKRGGAKGNVTLKSFDDCLKVEVKTATLVTYGAEIQRAKELFDEFVRESSDGATAELLALVTGAFQVDAEGKINRAKLVQIKRLSIDHPLWKAAMEALNEAERPGASRSYLRFWWRPNVEASWQAITVDVAAQ